MKNKNSYVITVDNMFVARANKVTAEYPNCMEFSSKSAAIKMAKNFIADSIYVIANYGTDTELTVWPVVKPSKIEVEINPVVLSMCKYINEFSSVNDSLWFIHTKENIVLDRKGNRMNHGDIVKYWSE